MRIIDAHTHGLGGYDTRGSSPDDLLKMAHLHGAHGVTDIFLTIYAGPIESMRRDMASVMEAMKLQARRWKAKQTPSDLPTGKALQCPDVQPARIKGVHLEGPFLNPSQPGALDAVYFQKPSQKLLKTLIEGFEDIVRIVTIAPELEGAVYLIRTLSDMGIGVNLGHSQATWAEAEAGFKAGARGITHLFNAMRGFHHREPGIAGFGLLNQEIYIEVIGDPFHLNEQTLKLIFAVKNQTKIVIVSDSVKETGTTTSLSPLRADSGTLRGGSMTVAEVSQRLIGMGFERDTVMRCISSNPASRFFP